MRIWFPKLPGVVMMSDQEVIIMCKPPEPVVTSRKAASYAGKLYVVENPSNYTVRHPLSRYIL